LNDSFEVCYTDSARNDLLRLFDFLLDRAQTAEDFDEAQRVIDTITREVEGQLSRAPFIFRKVGDSPFLRELIIPCKSTGNVALYEIEGNASVNILAVRHQLEEDYH
jgi:plasmid stabilization system protein ParE